ncbi:choice-of-anchor P family protein [Streptomyces sp. NPDC048441]|uniref:choice-of-anchor P family protein n=1 Tax=Streptomyces sp. NPDC048441 TaxID=3365552 RepID=UPI0037217584
MTSVKMGVSGRGTVGFAIAAALVAQASGTAQASGPAPVSGTAHAAAGSSWAYGFKASLGPVSIGHTAFSAYPGGPASASAASLTVGALGSVKGIASWSSGNAAAGTTAANGKIAQAKLDLGIGSFSTEAVTASCKAGPGGAPTGTVKIVDGSVKTALASLDLPVSPAPNTTLTLPGGLGEAVLNEQVKNPDGSLTVNALRVTVTAAGLNGSFRAASATCDAGTQDSKPVAKGSITGAALDQFGEPVGGVVYQVRNQAGRPVGPTCTTHTKGNCTVPALNPGTYRMCVIAVPDGYSMPKQKCKGPIKVDGKNVNVSFRIPPESGKKG